MNKPDEIVTEYAALASEFDLRSDNLIWPHRTIIELLPGIVGKDVADVGCGEGRWCRFLARFKPKSITGLDRVQDFIDIAKERTPIEQFSNVSYLVANQLSLKTFDKQYDLVLSIFTAHHEKRLKEVFANLACIVKKNGTLLIGVNTIPHDKVTVKKYRGKNVALCLLGKTIVNNYLFTLSDYVKAVEMNDLVVEQIVSSPRPNEIVAPSPTEIRSGLRVYETIMVIRKK